MNINDIFPYEYVGGGYFRRKGIEKGKPAETLHGMEAVTFAIEATLKAEQARVENRNGDY